MKIIDKYICKEFLYAVVGTIFICSVVLFISLIFENYDDIKDENISTLATMQFFLYSMPFKIIKVLPLTMILAVLFSMGHLAKNYEILAIVSSGVNQSRISYPILIITFIISLLSIVFNETVVSYTEYKAKRFQQIYIKKENPANLEKNTNIFLKGQGKRFFNIKSYNGITKVMKDPSIFEIDEEGTTIKSRMDAEEGKLISSSDEENKSTWEFQNAISREFDKNGAVAKITKYPDKYTVTFGEDLQTFLSVSKKPEEMDFFELWKYIKVVELRGIPVGEYKTDLHMKLAFPLSCLIVTLLGIPFAIRTKAGSMVIAFGFGIVVSIFYYFVTALCQTLGHSGQLPPILAAWLPNVLFLIFGIYTTKKIKY